MRISLSLAVVWALCVSVAAAPPEIAPAIETTAGDSTIVPHRQRDRLAAPEVVTARVYVSPDVGNDALRAALVVAQAAFSEASIDVAWKICGPSECNTPPLPTELMVRFVNSHGRRLDTRCLGDALIDMQRRTGVMATVYVDRVLQLARNLAIDHRTLLGWTIAHEMGHLLLATNAHGATGLMREVWSREELLEGRTDDWMLLPFEAAAIRQRLAQLVVGS